MHRNIARSVDAQSHLVASNIDDRYHDVVADHDALVSMSRQNQHRWLLPLDRRGTEARRRISCFYGEGMKDEGRWVLSTWTFTLGAGPCTQALSVAFLAQNHPVT